MHSAFVSSFHHPHSVLFSGRQIVSIGRDDLSTAATHRRVCLCSNVKADLLRRINMFFRWAPRDPSRYPPPSNASELVIIPEFRSAVSHHTGLRSFVKWLDSMRQQNRFQQWIPAGGPPEPVKAEAEAMFAAVKRDFKPNVLKAALVGSLLSDLVALMAPHKEVKGFAAIWGRS